MQMPNWMRYIETPGHGYFQVDDEHWDLMCENYPELLAKTTYYQGYNSFEEDCEVSRIALAFRDEMPEDWVRYADDWLINSHPEMYEAYTGLRADPHKSR